MAAKSTRTTMAKLNRERKLRERRVEKQARKEARRLAAVAEDERPVADGPDLPPEPEA
jgi:hypothetical protein